jgi:peptidoglycan/LPS O-acetylase OafA/YrhL
VRQLVREELVTAEGSPAEQAAHRRLSFSYQPALDGVRAFAVLGVLAYHGDESWARGGFLGVDAFFVLSGYLITSLLLSEQAKTSRISLRTFYARRARRLLPALLLVLGAVVAFGGLLWTGDQLIALRGDVWGALGYFSNWKFLASGQSYFQQVGAPSPLRHLWSLAIEEQWYFIWPALLALLLWWRWSLKLILALTVTLTLSSATLMAVLYQPGHDTSRVYYGTDTRAQSLLVGAALAIILFLHGPIRTRAARLTLQGLGIAAAIYTLWRWSATNELSSSLYRGGFLVGAVAVALVITAAIQPAPANPLRTGLSVTPLRWVGMISYGLYLWHWPVYLWLTTDRTGLTGLSLLAVRIGLTFAISIVSYFGVERPVRRGTFNARVAWAGGLTAVAAVGIGAMFVTDGAVSAIPAAIAPRPNASAATASGLDVAGTARAGSALQARQQIAGLDPIAPGTRRVLFVGDSVMWSLGIGIPPEVEHDANLVVGNGAVWRCGLAQGLVQGLAGGLSNGMAVPGADSGCDWPRQWPQLVAALHPDVSVLMPGLWDILDRRIDGRWLHFGSRAYDRYLQARIHQAVAILSAEGGRVVFMSAPPFSKSPYPGITEPWSPADSWRLRHVNRLVRTTVSGLPGVSVIDFASYLCPRGTCRDLRWDGLHFGVEQAVAANAWIVPHVLAAAGLPPR